MRAKKEWVGKRVRVKTCRRAFYGRDPKKNGFFIARTGEKEVGIFSGGSKGEQNKKTGYRSYPGVHSTVGSELLGSRLERRS